MLLLFDRADFLDGEGGRYFLAIDSIELSLGDYSRGQVGQIVTREHLVDHSWSFRPRLLNTR